jgi:hypothetical protein
MPASLDRVRETMDVQPTKQDKGLTLTLRVTAYDNGMIQLDGVPINVEPDYDPVQGFLGTVATIGTTLEEFWAQVQQRRRSRT